MSHNGSNQSIGLIFLCQHARASASNFTFPASARITPLLSEMTHCQHQRRHVVSHHVELSEVGERNVHSQEKWRPYSGT